MSSEDLSIEMASASTTSIQRPKMPSELLLAIIDIALEESQQDDSTSARCLLSVSHALRTYAMPKVYGVLIINITHSSQHHNGKSTTGPVIGHDGRKHEYPHLALLSWLLCDPTAEPRKYIKHIVMSQIGTFNVSDIVTKSERNSSRIWTIDRLIVRNEDRSTKEFYKAGIRAREVHYIGMEDVVFLDTDKPLAGIAFASGHIGWFKQGTRGHFRCWLYRTDESSVEWKSPYLVGFVHRQLNPVDGELDGTMPEANRRGQFVMIEVHGELEMLSSDHAVRDIESILLDESNQTVVLVHPPGDRAVIDQITAIIAAAKRVLPRELYRRLRVSPVGWDRELLLRSPMHAYASLLRRGIDPWDDGHVPAALLTE